MTIDKQALRDAAQKATGGEWLVYEKPVMSYMDAIHCLAKILQGTEGEQKSLYMINADGLCPALTGTGPNAVNNARYLSMVSPATTLALLDVLEAAEKRNAEMSESNRLLCADSMIKQDRIAELEARTVRVELTPPRNCPPCSDWNAGFESAMVLAHDRFKAACVAAGIKCEVV